MAVRMMESHQHIPQLFMLLGPTTYNHTFNDGI